MILVMERAGFIGSQFVEAFLSGGWKLRNLDDLSTGNVKKLEDARGRFLPTCGGAKRHWSIFPLGNEVNHIFLGARTIQKAQR
jgi:nucleoside-diphosphate-sugar epimerase